MAREEMPAPSVWLQPLRLRLDSAVSALRGARSAPRRMPWQCCSLSADSCVSPASGSSLGRHHDRIMRHGMQPASASQLGTQLMPVASIGAALKAG